jgi:hypothetical protein
MLNVKDFSSWLGIICFWAKPHDDITRKVWGFPLPTKEMFGGEVMVQSCMVQYLPTQYKALS